MYVPVHAVHFPRVVLLDLHVAIAHKDGIRSANGLKRASWRQPTE